MIVNVVQGSFRFKFRFSWIFVQLFDDRENCEHVGFCSSRLSRVRFLQDCSAKTPLQSILPTVIGHLPLGT